MDNIRQKLWDYLEDGCTACPFCGSHDIDGHTDGFEVDMECPDCGEEWTDYLSVVTVRYSPKDGGKDIFAER